MKKSLSLFLFLLNTMAWCQNSYFEYAGYYGAPGINLTLNEDGTFAIMQSDPLFTNTHKKFKSTGTWSVSGNELTLNPNLPKRQREISITEKIIPGADSLVVKINYIIETYSNDALVSREKVPFDMFSVYVNKKRNYRHMVPHLMQRGSCAFATRIRQQYVIDSLTTVKFKMPKQAEKIGIMTYGFDNYIELIPRDPSCNYFEITVVEPLDTDRVPRSKKMIIKGKNAYYYERKGKIDFGLTPLMLNYSYAW